MKEKLFFLFCLIAVSANVFAQKLPELKPVKDLETEITPTAKKDKWGYANEKGRFVIKAVFDEAMPFAPVTSYDGVTMPVARIRVGDQWGFITREGIYLIEPRYEDLTDFDAGGNAVGTFSGKKELLGVISVPNAKGSFQTLIGNILASGIDEIEPFRDNGIAWASRGGKWGIETRTGKWLIYPNFDSRTYDDALGFYLVSEGGKTGGIDADGRIVFPVEFDSIGWDGEQKWVSVMKNGKAGIYKRVGNDSYTCVFPEEFDSLDWDAQRGWMIARKDGKVGVYDKNGRERYACIFDDIPVETSMGYVEMWQDGEPALYLPEKGVSTLKDYIKENGRSAMVPAWAKVPEGTPEKVIAYSGFPEPLDLSGYKEDYENGYPSLSDILLKCGKSLSDALVEANKHFGIYVMANGESLECYDCGNVLYVGSHDMEEMFTLTAVDLQDVRNSWSKPAVCGFVFREKDGLLADGGKDWGLKQRTDPVRFKRNDRPYVPVLRYGHYKWGGLPVVLIGNNRCSGDDDSGMIRVYGDDTFELGDMINEENDRFAEESAIKIHEAGPDGIAIYEIRNRRTEYAEDGTESKGEFNTVAFGYIGLETPFFTQAVFDGVSDIKDGAGEVKVDGEWRSLSLEQLKEMDPFMLPGETRSIPSGRNTEDKPSRSVRSQSSTQVNDSEAIPFKMVEKKPSFNGGDANDFSKWVNANLVYPEIAKENGVQGRVSVQFTIYEDGTLKDVKVIRGVDPSLDKEAVRVVSMSPKWVPGQQDGKDVKVTYTFPVIFQLR